MWVQECRAELLVVVLWPRKEQLDACLKAAVGACVNDLWVKEMRAGGTGSGVWT